MIGPVRVAETALVGLFLVAIYVWASASLASFDLWFYLRMGEEIVSSGSIPHYQSFLSTADTFSPTYDINPEWAMSLLCFGVYEVLGETGLLSLKGLLITALAAVLYRTCRLCGVSPALAVGWCWLGMLVMRSRFLLRAGLVTDLALALLVHYLIRVELGHAANRPTRVFWLFLIWANFHHGVVSGLALLGIYWLFSLTGRSRVASFTTLAWAGAGSLCRPGGYRLYEFVLDHMNRPLPMRLVLEWRPLEGHWYLGALGLFCLVVAWSFWRARSRGRFLWSHLAVCGAYFCLAFRYVRALGELTPVVVPLAAFAAGSTGGRRRLVEVGLVAGLMVWSWPGLPHYDHFPEGGIAYLRTHPPRGRVHNTYAYGGLMAFRGLAPFVHGMTTLYPDSLLLVHNTIIHNSEKREALLADYRVGAVLMRYPAGGEAQFGEFLKESPLWNLVYLDDTCLVYWRGEPPTEPYKLLASKGGELTGPGNDDLKKELLRVLEVTPQAAKPRMLLAELAYHKGEVDRAVELLQEVTENPVFQASAFTRLGELYTAEERYQEALEAFRRSLKRAPGQAKTFYKMARVYQALEKPWAARYSALRALYYDGKFEVTGELLESLPGMPPRGGGPDPSGVEPSSP